MYLQQHALEELFKWCLNDKQVASLTVESIGASDFKKELKDHKAVLSIIKAEYEKSGECLTLGELQQKFYSRGHGESAIFDRIGRIKLGDKDRLLTTLASHMKQVKTVQAYEDFGEAFQKSDKEAAIQALTAELNAVENITFKREEIDSTNPFTTLLQTLNAAELEHELNGFEKMPLGIRPLDDKISGGIDRKDTALFILPSGGGKSTILKTIGASCSRIGYKGLHFQLEGGTQEVQLKYGQIISGISYHKQLTGNTEGVLKKPRWVYLEGQKVKIDSLHDLLALNEAKMERLRKRRGQFILDVYSYENLGDANLGLIIEKIDEWVGKNGCNPDFILVDSIDLLHPGDGKRYSTEQSGIKARLQACGQALKNLATVYNTRVLTATQTSDVPFEKWNDPAFCITRNYTMGDKNLVNAFSYVFSGNSTQLEKKQNKARIFCDKLRHGSLANPVIHVKTALQYGKYVNKKATLEELATVNSPNFVPNIGKKSKKGKADEKDRQE